MNKILKSFSILSTLIISLMSINVYAENIKNEINNLQKENIKWEYFFIAHSWLKNTSGVIYFQQDLKNNPKQMCEDLKENPWRLTMIDQESTEIYRLNIKSSIPPSYNSKLNLDEFSKKVSQSAKILKEYCLNVNLAPVADNQKGMRQYSDEFNKNLEYVDSFAKNMRINNIIPTYKHFPGLNKIEDNVYSSPYRHYFKNIYGEGVIDLSTEKELIKNSEIFKNNNYDLLMFSIGIYPNIKDSPEKPIVFSEKIWQLAYNTQPNSLYIPDDLSELNLSEEEIIYLFKKFDLLLYTSPKDVMQVIKILDMALDKKLITLEEIEDKLKRQNQWREKNNLPILILK